MYPIRYRALRTAFYGLLFTLPVTGMTAAQPLPIIMNEAAFAALPRISAAPGGSQLLDRGALFQASFDNKASAASEFKPGQSVRIFRQGLRLLAPGSNAPLGILAVVVGEARILDAAEVAANVMDGDSSGAIWLRVITTHQEVMPDDSLLPATALAQWQPTSCPAPAADDHQPPGNQRPEVIAIAGDFNMLASNNHKVIMSGGCNQGYQPGNRVSIWRAPEKLHTRQAGSPVDNSVNNALSVFIDNPPIDRIETPPVRVGTARVLSAYPDTAILQILSAQRPVQNGDPVRRLPNGNTP